MQLHTDTLQYEKLAGPSPARDATDEERPSVPGRDIQAMKTMQDNCWIGLALLDLKDNARPKLEWSSTALSNVLK